MQLRCNPHRQSQLAEGQLIAFSVDKYYPVASNRSPITSNGCASGNAHVFVDVRMWLPE